MSSPGKCLVPPAGWWCSRDAGHEGPCAARPIAEVPAEVAEVLQELIEEMTNRAMEHDDDWRSGGAPESWRVATGIRQARDMVEAAQSKAATGSRAAGGEPPWAACGQSWTHFDGHVATCVVKGPHEIHRDESGRWHQAPAAPPAPAAPGVAELLAELTDRERAFHGLRYDPVMSFTEIRRYLAPGGADGGQS